MRKSNLFTNCLLAGVVVVASAIAAQAQNGAQSAASATVASPANASAAASGDPKAPAGPQLSPMPKASVDQFQAAEKAAATSVMSGAAGVSDKTAAPSTDAPMAYGTSTAPYTTKRVAVGKAGNSAGVIKIPVTSYPYRATGKLYFQIGTSTYVCTASLVKPGVLITAAHCVTAFGGAWYSNWTWCPSNTDSSGGVYGCYSGVSARTASSYKGGTDTCTQSGVVCNNDIATILLAPKNGVLAGNTVGWYNYGWNGYSYATASMLGGVRVVQITQLGYPVAFDSGYQMQRTDAVGWYYTSGNLKNTQIGTAQTGGSSGGPWLANFGTNPVINTSAASGGTQQVQSVIGVTSYGSTTVGYNRQGASYFGQNTEFPSADYGGYGAGNIGKLMQDTCTASPTYC
ncbi:MAG: hypothetical protein QM651_13240 [Rhodoblastus sp.]